MAPAPWSVRMHAKTQGEQRTSGKNNITTCGHTDTRTAFSSETSMLHAWPLSYTPKLGGAAQQRRVILLYPHKRRVLDLNLAILGNLGLQKLTLCPPACAGVWPRVGTGAPLPPPRPPPPPGARRPKAGLEGKTAAAASAAAAALESCAMDRGPLRGRLAGLTQCLAPLLAPPVDLREARSTMSSNLCAAQNRARPPSSPYLGRLRHPGSPQRGFCIV